ncbi:hypothetical protein G7Y89_g3600 [Cudoniella acicularis]|uniref:beta-glucosidase n=1 Tax=Cudoniella acicularis TaxID=354080 RepID=A0A8H4RR15_9HELO|nr:hypothetical protein G7Y89_g3600 [Cudoniella acicularis]
MARLDDMVIRNMMGYFHYNQDEDYPALAGVTDYVDVRSNHSKLARTYAANSIALLKNTNNALPLKNKTSISIFGLHAAPRYVGANTALTVYNGVGPTMFRRMATVGMSGTGTELSGSTVGVAAHSDIINASINTTGTRLLDQWITHENVTGVIYGGPLGQESGNAIDDVLFSAVNLSGRLLHTIAKNESDYNSNTQITQSLELNYTEGNYIDYKYFDKYNVTPRYEFGYSLSYTTFNYSSQVTVSPNTTALSQSYATGALAIGGREDLWGVAATASSSFRTQALLQAQKSHSCISRSQMQPMSQRDSCAV